VHLRLARYSKGSAQGGEELANIQDQPAFLTPMQCAAKLQLSRWTIYHWISGGKLGTEQGLRRLGRKRMIDWNALKVAIERGDLE
jgi:predicted DNA-binding transcriptional regulator AlpA